MAPFQLPGGFRDLMTACHHPSHLPRPERVFLSSSSSSDSNPTASTTTKLALGSMLLGAYAVLSTLLAIAVLVDWASPHTTGRSPRRRILLLCTGLPTLAFMFALPLMTAHLLLQLVVWLCLDIFIFTIRRQKRQHGLFPSITNRTTSATCGAQLTLTTTPAPPAPLRLLKRYVELPPPRWSLPYPPYDAPLPAGRPRALLHQALDAASPTTNCTHPREVSVRQRRHALQRWWNAQRDRRQRLRQFRKLRPRLLPQYIPYSPTLPAMYED
ncbi:hypothetical protein PG993_003095 [Apiospora rasikravindrae]|uniref:Uncharacterized protein n=1 Tax=Apiospora rasikravindrae TaxID=990691 RepID=A0ABR1U0U0_9PEZI